MLCESTIRDHLYLVWAHKVKAELKFLFAASLHTRVLVCWHNYGHSGVFNFLVSVFVIFFGLFWWIWWVCENEGNCVFGNLCFLDGFAGVRNCKEIWQPCVPLARHEKTCSAFELSIWSTTRLPLYREWMCATPNFKVSACPYFMWLYNFASFGLKSGTCLPAGIQNSGFLASNGELLNLLNLLQHVHREINTGLIYKQ